MAATVQTFVSVPVTANSPLVIFSKQGNSKAIGRIVFKFENIGTKTFTGKVQESVDGVTYSDVSGATTTLVKKGESIVNVLTSTKYLKIVGSGDTSLRIDTTYEGQLLRGSLDILVISSTGTSAGGIVDNLTRVYDGLN